MTFQHLRLEISDQIGTIMLDRPEKLNALSVDLHYEMVEAANQLQADDDVRVVIVTGAGRGFCSGADLTARPGETPRIVFVASVFSGMGVLVARFAGADKPEEVNRTVFQAFLTAVFLALGVLAPLGYVLAPALLDMINAAPEVQVEALPYLRVSFVFSIGMLIFFMMSGALRAAGDLVQEMRPDASLDRRS